MLTAGEVAQISSKCIFEIARTQWTERGAFNSDAFHTVPVSPPSQQSLQAPLLTFPHRHHPSLPMVLVYTDDVLALRAQP